MVSDLKLVPVDSPPADDEQPFLAPLEPSSCKYCATVFAKHADLATRYNLTRQDVLRIRHKQDSKLMMKVIQWVSDEVRAAGYKHQALFAFLDALRKACR